MSYLIQINEKTGEVLHPEVMKLVASFQHLTNQEMIYVVLFTDYHSPLKQFPEPERKRQAMYRAFNDNETELIESARIKIAIEEYTSLQYSPDMELIRKYQKKIDHLQELLENDDTLAGTKKTLETINLFRENILSLQDKFVEQTKADGVIKGDRQLSFLERMLNNKKLYKSTVKEK